MAGVGWGGGEIDAAVLLCISPSIDSYCTLLFQACINRSQELYFRVDLVQPRAGSQSPAIEWDSFLRWICRALGSIRVERKGWIRPSPATKADGRTDGRGGIEGKVLSCGQYTCPSCKQ